MEHIIEDRPLDLTYLKQMVGDNPEFMIEIFEVFTSQTPIFAAEMNAAALKDDWKTIAGAVHKMKPTFVYIGRDDVMQLAQSIEVDTRNFQNLDTINMRIAQLDRCIEIIYKQLDAAKLTISSKL